MRTPVDYHNRGLREYPRKPLRVRKKYSNAGFWEFPLELALRYSRFIRKHKSFSTIEDCDRVAGYVEMPDFLTNRVAWHCGLHSTTSNAVHRHLFWQKDDLDLSLEFAKERGDKEKIHYLEEMVWINTHAVLVFEDVCHVVKHDEGLYWGVVSPMFDTYRELLEGKKR